MLGQVFTQVLQLQLPLLGLLPPQLLRYRPIQLSFKGLLQAALDGLNPLGNGFQGIPVEPGFLGRGGFEAGFHVLNHFRPDGHTFNDVPELFDQFLLPDGLPLLGARPLPARAMVVDISAFLDLRRDRASAFLAGQQPAKGEIVLLLLGMVRSPERGLDCFKLLHGDKARIGAFE